MKKANQKKPVKQGFQISNGILLAAILILTFIVYSGSLSNGFVTWDDPDYLTDNKLIKDLSFHGIQNLFTSYYSGNYHPLTGLSNAIEYKLFGLKAAPFHFFNLLFHLANIILVFFIVLRLFARKDAAAFIAALFAIHPMHVESVAWLSERKDLLYTLFFFAAWLSYLKYMQNGFARKHLWISLILFLCSLLSKSMAVSLPVVLLLTDYFFKRKLTGKVIIEKIPFFILSIAFGIIAIQSQTTGGSTDIAPHFPFLERIFLAMFGVGHYLLTLIAPYKLSAFHPYPKSLTLLHYITGPLILLLLGWLVYRSRDHRRTLIFGFLFFIVALAPVIQLFPVGQALVADRYTYMPYLGLFFLIIPSLDKRAVKTTLVIAIAIFSVISFQRTKVWKDGITLFTDVIEKYPNVEFAYYNRGLTKNYNGDYEGAVADYNKAIAIKPDYVVAYYNRGYARGMFKDFKGAIADFDSTIKLYPQHSMAFNNRGNAKGMLNDYQGAVHDFDEAVRIKPDYSEAYFNRGLTKLNLNDKSGACIDWQKAQQLHYPAADEMLEKYCSNLK